MLCLTNIKNVSYAKALASPTPIVSGITASYVIIELKPVQSTSVVNNYATITQVLDIYDMQGNKLSPDGTALEAIN